MKTKEVKPIAVIYIPYSDFWGPGMNISDMMALLNGWDERVTFGERFQDYLWFVFVKQSIEAPELQVFHPKDFTEIQQQELKDLVMKHIESQNKTTND